MTFEDDLNAPVDPEWADVDILLNGKPYTLRFTAVDGLTWADQCDRCPARPGVKLDSVYGYDIRALTKAIAPLSGALVAGDTTAPLRVDPIDPRIPNAPRTDEWAELFEKIDGSAWKRISDAIWAVNEYYPSEAVKAAKKALAGSEEESQQPSI